VTSHILHPAQIDVIASLVMRSLPFLTGGYNVERSLPRQRYRKLGEAGALRGRYRLAAT
jgi:hypothetical protein